MNQPLQTITARNRVAAYWLTGLVLALLFAGQHGVEWRGSDHLHTNMEIIATVLAAFVGLMALVRFYSKKDNTFLFIGSGFLGTAFLDGYHAVVTSEFFRPFMPSDLPSLIPWSWVASRQFLSVMVLLSWYCWHRSQRLGLLRNNGDSVTPVIIFSGQDFEPKIADEVHAVLVKSSTSNEKLLSTIQTCINQHRSAEK